MSNLGRPFHWRRSTRTPVVLRHAGCGGEWARARCELGVRRCTKCRAVLEMGIADPQIGGRRGHEDGEVVLPWRP